MDYVQFEALRRESELYHHGIIGQKWGVRRYQNEDGSLTDAGRRRYLDPATAKNSQTRDAANDYNSLSNREFRSKYQTTKNTFARRYKKTNGDTYSLGLKKQAKAQAILEKTGPKGASLNELRKETIKSELEFAGLGVLTTAAGIGLQSRGHDFVGSYMEAAGIGLTIGGLGTATVLAGANAVDKIKSRGK